jgi:enolase
LEKEKEIKMGIIVDIKGREILNAKGRPTVEAEVITSDNLIAVASVPSGTSRGEHEAFELYDKEQRHQGYGVRKAANNVSTLIKERLVGMDVSNQTAIDAALCTLDGTPDKSSLGANAILPVSLAVAKLGAMINKQPLYSYINLLFGIEKIKMPNILATVIAGGLYSSSGLEFEDYMYLLQDFKTFADQLEAIVELRRVLQEIITKKYGPVLEDGGALAPPLRNSEEAFDFLLEAARITGYENNVAIGLDVAASGLFDKTIDKYKLGANLLSKEELIDRYVAICEAYPLLFLEDGLEEHDFIGFNELKQRLSKLQIVGDDLFCTNPSLIKKGIAHDSANTLLLKVKISHGYDSYQK